jgi:hypothetical protein
MLTYKKDGGENYPVQPGEVWHVGAHQIRCGDLTNHKDHVWLQGFVPDLVYCDPPWGQALATGFRTKAGLTDFVSYQSLYKTVFRLVALHYPDVPAYFEQGRKWTAEMQEIAAAEGLELTQDWDITYDGKSPATLTMFNAAGRSHSNLRGYDDMQTPGMAIVDHTRQGDLVLDPMTGRGLTAWSAADLGRRFVGLELSPHRVSVTLTKLHKLTGLEPHRGN